MAFLICEKRGWTWAEWSALSKTERARLYAFNRMSAAAEEFGFNEKELAAGGVTLEAWLRMEPEDREFKLESLKWTAQNA